MLFVALRATQKLGSSQVPDVFSCVGGHYIYLSWNELAATCNAFRSTVLTVAVT